MKRLAAVALVGMLVTAVVQADVIYSNFGPGTTFDSGVSYVLSGPSSPVGMYTMAMPFIPSASYTLDSATVAIGIDQGTNSFDLAVYDDSGGRPGSTVLESWSGIVMGPDHSATTTETVLSASNPLLTGGSPYWLVASASADTWAGWMYNSTGDLGGYAFSTTGPAGPWNVSPPLSEEGAYSVMGTPAGATVPEPATFALFALGLVGILGRRRKK